MRFLFSTGSLWSYSIERCFHLAEQAGFDGIEVVIDQRWESRQSYYLAKLIERHRMPVLAVHSPFMPDIPGWPSDQPSRIQRAARLAEEVGADVVVHHLPARFGFAFVQSPGRRFFIPTPTNPEVGYRHWIESEYENFQSSTGVKLCIENMPAYRRFGRRWNYCHWNTPQKLNRFPNLTMDTTHLGTWGIDPLDFYSTLNSRIRHIHLSNYNNLEHQRPETGMLRLDHLLTRLAEDNYQNLITLELYPDALDAGEEDEVILGHLRTSLEYCRRWSELQHT
jgi:sugar phosphate isomerase/epimerase